MSTNLFFTEGKGEAKLEGAPGHGVGLSISELPQALGGIIVGTRRLHRVSGWLASQLVEDTRLGATGKPNRCVLPT